MSASPGTSPQGLPPLQTSITIDTTSFSRSQSPKTRAEPSSSGRSTRSGSFDPNEPSWPHEWQAYTALMGCFFLMFNSWGLVNAYGTFASYYKEILTPNKDLYLINLIGSTESAIVLFFSFIVGRLLDAGFSKFILPSGAVLVTLGMFLLSLESVAHEAEDSGKYILIWVTQGLTTGLGMACFFVASSQIASTWFINRKSFAIGIVASGASIAGLVYPFMIRELIDKIGWNSAVRATAGLTAGTAIISAITAQPNPKHPLNKGTNNKWMTVERWIDPPAFRNATFNWFCAAIALMFFGFYAVFFNLEEWIVHKGLGSSSSSSDMPSFIYLAVMNGASTFGRLSSGYLSDKYGALNVHFIVMFVSSLLLLLLWTFATNTAAAFAFVIIFGAFSGAVIGMPPATIANIIGSSPETDMSRMGHWTGMMYTMASPFALAGPVIAGHLITSTGLNFLTVQLWSGFCLLLSSLCIGAAIYCLRRKEQRDGSFERLRRFSSKLFDVENGSIFRSGAATAVNTRPPTRDASEDEKEKETRHNSTVSA